jgi:hypothetical protein
VLALIRPDDWNLPLFLHVLGAMVLVGALVLAAGGLAGVTRGGGVASIRMAYRSLLIVALPSWIVMRVAAQWIADKEGLAGDDPPAWIDLGFMLSESTFLLLIAATILAGVGVRRAGAADGGGGTQGKIANVLVGIVLLAYVVAIWAMTAKPT